ncbi:hypothetical protein NSP_51640 [Nodularia spumigena CCY9414]|nr:hypothetical protein NSP_51640 [Nodularia spumigena CCY9414]
MVNVSGNGGRIATRVLKLGSGEWGMGSGEWGVFYSEPLTRKIG